VSVAGNAAATMTTGSVYDRGLPAQPPAQCVQWCHANDYGITVADDLAAVDLDWWNSHLESHRVPVRLWGTTIDATPTDTGAGFLRRSDINGSLPDDGPADLCVLYRAAAWYRHLLTVQTL